MPLFPPTPAEAGLVSTLVTRKTESMTSSQNLDANFPSKHLNVQSQH